MKKMLITGFEPFGGEKINPSLEAVERLPMVVGGYELTKLTIPVVFGEAAEKVIRRAEEIAPDVVLCIGQAGGRDAMTPELVGINLRHATMPDNGGNQPQDEAIRAGGSDAYFSPLPVRRMAEAIRAVGVPSRVSYSAGAYVCNDVLYSLLAHFYGSETRVGFIHIPYSDEQGKEPSLALCDMVRGLIAAIEHID